jgi:menaquinone-9 beta-reductase
VQRKRTVLHDILIIGGGIAGLTNAILLSKAGLNVILIEKKQYPLHKVCGEYVSNEALPFLKGLGIDPFVNGASSIRQFMISTSKSNVHTSALGMGGFGLSRYVFDNLLYENALKAGATIVVNTGVADYSYNSAEDSFDVKLTDGKILKSKILVGAYGKRSALDRTMHRAFFNKRSPYIGIKYHLHTDFPPDTIALHLFKDGYCGINQIEEGKVCLCYLTTRENLRKSGTILLLEKNILFRNPYIKSVLEHADVLYDKPEVINEISFSSKETVVNHALMCGDAAGMIAPLCGNGMAMAMRAAKICSAEITDYLKGDQNREAMEKKYAHRWKAVFESRLTRGRIIQKMFNKPLLMDAAVGFSNLAPFFSRWMIGQTHGPEF